MTDDTAEKRHTLGLMFGLEGGSWPELPKVEAANCLRELRKQLPRGVPATYWPTVMAELGEKIREALDVPISTIIGSAWQAYGPFLKYLDRKKYPPGEVSIVPLASHTIESSLKPSVEIFVDDHRLGQIELEVKLELELKGANVSVQDGKFRRLRLASGTLKGTLSVEHVVLVDRSSKEHELPGEISFGDGGFPIGVVARNDATPSLPAPPAVRAEAAQR